MLVKCAVCGSALVGRQRKYCGRRCKNRDTNQHHQNYRSQKSRGAARKRAFLRERGTRCNRCGYAKSYAALVWHHVVPKLKSYELDLRAMSNRSLPSLRAEVAKCELLCANCHLEHHHPDAML